MVLTVINLSVIAVVNPITFIYSLCLQMNIEQVKKFTSLERHGSRDSLGMDDVLSPVRPITHAPETAVSPHTLVVASHNVDDGMHYHGCYNNSYSFIYII